MDRRRLTILVEVERGGDEIAGTVALAGADARSFAGWVGLVAALDGLLAEEHLPVADAATTADDAA